MDPTVTIRNKVTGEVKQVPQSQLGSYGASSPAPTSSPTTPAPQQDSGGGFASFLPLIGALGGSFIPGLGPIIGGALGAGAGTLLKQGINHQADPGEVVSQAALAGAGGVGGKLLGGLLGKILPDTLSKVGEGAIASQYNVPRNVARAIDFPNSIGTLATKYGVTDASKIPQIAEQVTGANGVISRITRDAVAKANPVELGSQQTAVGGTPSVMDVAQNLVADPSISSGTETKFLKFVDKGVTQSLGGKQGSISGLGNPSEVFGFIQKLEDTARGITRGRAPTAITAEDKALASAYKGVAAELRDRLFQQSGANQALTEGAVTPEHLAELSAIHPQLAQDVSNARTVGDLRGIAAPFVQANQAAAETNAGSQFGFQNLAGAAKGMGKMVPTLGNPLAPIQAGLSSPGVNAALGKGALKGAEILKGLPLPSSDVLQRLGVSTAAGLGSGNPTPVQASESSPTSSTTPAPLKDPQDVLRQTLGMLALKKARSINDLVAGYNLLYPKPTAGQMTPQESNVLNNELDQFSNAYKTMNPVQRLNPLDPTNRQLQTIRTTMIAQVRKAIVGGRATQQELTWIMNLLPPLNHPSAAIYPSDTVDAAIEQLKTSLGASAPTTNIPLPANSLGL